MLHKVFRKAISTIHSNNYNNNNYYYAIPDISEFKKEINPLKTAIKFALIYGFTDILLEFLLEYVLDLLIPDINTYRYFELIKNGLHIIITTVLIFIVIHRNVKLCKNAMQKTYETYDELSSTHEELVAIEEELRQQFNELEKHRNALIISEQRYELAVEGSNDGIWDWDVQNDVYYFSTKWKKALGYDPQELDNTHNSLLAIMHPDDRDRALKTLNNYKISKKGIYKNTYRLYCKDGSYLWILSRGVGIWDEQGSAVRIAGSHTDITEQIQLQEHLRMEKEFSESILNNAQVIIVVLDNDGIMMRLNQYTTKITGYKENEFSGKKWIDIFIPHEKRKHMLTVLNDIQEGKFLYNYESQIVCKDGKLLDVLWNISLLYNYDGSISGILCAGTDITYRKQLENIMYNMAYYDALTGLPNRLMLISSFNSIINEKSSTGGIMAVLFIEIDNLKHINDLLGHTSGDKLMKHVSSILQKYIKSPDIVSRLGGDEFVAVLTSVKNKTEIISEVEKIRLCLKEPWVIDKHEFYISASMGIAIYPEHGRDLETLLKNANTAMYNVKETVRGNYCIYTQEMKEKESQYTNIANQLGKAIQNNEFTIHYQPQIDLNTGKIAGVEALLRWMNPEQGYIPPAYFIPIAEQTGYILDISYWVVKESFEQKKRWSKKGFPPVLMSINLSRKCIFHTDLLRNMIELADITGIQHEQIQFEITETTVMTDINAAINVLKHIKNLGFRIALDDFGTGYSSLYYIKQLPIDTVKLDQTLIQNISNINDDEVILKSLIKLAHELNLEVVAEGIETIEQLEVLKKYKCDKGQGFLFYAPLLEEEVEKIFENLHI
ncbi:MAG TPA: EAL domain-containing protein [Clostridiales bacterium]|nr:EAL domain-containing protein [Clostridiales bacterium]